MSCQRTGNVQIELLANLRMEPTRNRILSRAAQGRQSARPFIIPARTRWSGWKTMAALAVAIVAVGGAVLLASEIRRAPETLIRLFRATTGPQPQ
jgi:hypothetical protein